ncbi:MAG: chemotaxis protein CheW [Proteobacteria bacterium]|nr:chemotaxis protein CheW [Pseudomonadota bacterium]MBU1715813.1 chemotaxis protein CheW [Pseudomonadota bacterium]
MAAKDVRRGENLQVMPELAGKYLTFVLGEEEYGIFILQVREIIGIMEITSVPHTPPYVKGVINLRGRVIPVIDLRLKFAMAAREYDDRTCIIVVEVQGREGTIMVGMLVDSVSEVVNVSGTEVEPPPVFGTKFGSSDNILGMAKINNEVKILLDTYKVIGEGVVEHFEKK